MNRSSLSSLVLALSAFALGCTSPDSNPGPPPTQLGPEQTAAIERWKGKLVKSSAGPGGRHPRRAPAAAYIDWRRSVGQARRASPVVSVDGDVTVILGQPQPPGETTKEERNQTQDG